MTYLTHAEIVAYLSTYLSRPARQIGPRRGAGIPLVITALGLAALEKAGAL